MQSLIVIHASSSIDKATILVRLQNCDELISHKIQESMILMYIQEFTNNIANAWNSYPPDMTVSTCLAIAS